MQSIVCHIYLFSIIIILISSELNITLYPSPVNQLIISLDKQVANAS